MRKSLITSEHIKKLDWAIWMSQVNLDSLREGDWLNLKHDLYDFISFAPPQVSRAYPLKQFESAMTKKAVAKIQSEMKEKITKLTFKEGDRMGDAYLDLTPITVSQICLLGHNDDRPFILYLNPPTFGKSSAIKEISNNVYCSLAYNIYASQIGRPQLRICPQVECQRIFLAKRKPRADLKNYCSNRCATLAATQAYREREKNKIGSKERERNHRRYEEKIRRQPGMAKVKIARRPLKASGN